MNTLSLKNYDDMQGLLAVSHTAAESIMTGKQIRQFVTGLSNGFIAILASFLAFPLGVIVYLVLAYQVRKLKRYVLKDFVLDINNYKKHRQQLSKLSKIISELKEVREIQPLKLKWYDKPFVNMAKSVVDIMCKHHDRLEAKLRALDTPPIGLPDQWQVVTGQELWDGRPSGYEYLV